MAAMSSTSPSSWGNIASALPRRFYTLVWLAVIAIAALLFLGWSDNEWVSVPSSPKDWKVPYMTDTGSISGLWNFKSEKLRISILEVGGTHDEVVSALIHSFGGQKDAELSMFLKNQRYGITDITNNFTLTSPIVSHNSSHDLRAAIDTQQPPHVLVSTTCELDLPAAEGPLDTLLDYGQTYLFCVFHHADRWVEGKHVNIVKRWAAAGKVDFIGLSQHTANFLQANAIDKWEGDASPNIRVLPPVFPVELPAPDPSHGLQLAMQGDYSSGRRDYQGIFTHLGEVIEQVKKASDGKEKVALHVIGHGKPPDVPENVRSQVIFDQDVSYPDFYNLLSRAFSIIPAFASNTYFDRKASSSVPAALIAGTPIVGSQELLDAYTYLPADAVWFANPGETEMDVIQRVVSEKDEYIRKARFVRATRKHLLKENIVHVKQWIVDGLKALKE